MRKEKKLEKRQIKLKPKPRIVAESGEFLLDLEKQVSDLEGRIKELAQLKDFSPELKELVKQKLS